ncbi:DNase I-like protein, partial [Trametes coccinea BRFM310]
MTATQPTQTNPADESQPVQAICASPPRGGHGPIADVPVEERRALYDSEQRPNDERQPIPSWKRKRARLRLGTLNVKGYGLPLTRGLSEKWLSMSRVLRDSKLDLLALQETHLTAERVERINSLLEPNYTLLHSESPNNPAGSGGIAFIVNMKRMNAPQTPITVLVPGRAAVVNYQWSPTRSITILTVYAPNNVNENEGFWNELNEQCSQRRLRIDVLLGDHNVVEDAIDRLPSRSDPAAAVSALTRLREAHRLVDSWREAHATKRTYTYLHSNGTSQSRLDRIYVTKSLQRAAADWSTTYVGLPTDHAMVSLSLANYDAPVVGNGRWRMPVNLLTDKPFLEAMRTMGMEYQNELDELPERTALRNPQTVHANFKSRLLAAARERTKERAANRNKRLNKLKTQLTGVNKEIESHPDNLQLAETSAMLRERIHEQEKHVLGQSRSASAARFWIQGEKIGKYWLR